LYTAEGTESNRIGKTVIPPKHANTDINTHTHTKHTQSDVTISASTLTFKRVVHN